MVLLHPFSSLTVTLYIPFARLWCKALRFELPSQTNRYCPVPPVPEARRYPSVLPKHETPKPLKLDASEITAATSAGSSIVTSEEAEHPLTSRPSTVYVPALRPPSSVVTGPVFHS